MTVFSRSASRTLYLISVFCLLLLRTFSPRWLCNVFTSRITGQEIVEFFTQKFSQEKQVRHFETISQESFTFFSQEEDTIVKTVPMSCEEKVVLHRSHEQFYALLTHYSSSVHLVRVFHENETMLLEGCVLILFWFTAPQRSERSSFQLRHSMCQQWILWRTRRKRVHHRKQKDSIKKKRWNMGSNDSPSRVRVQFTDVVSIRVPSSILHLTVFWLRGFQSGQMRADEKKRKKCHASLDLSRKLKSFKKEPLLRASCYRSILSICHCVAWMQIHTKRQLAWPFPLFFSSLFYATGVTIA